jgi:hypothetical protein
MTNKDYVTLAMLFRRFIERIQNEANIDQVAADWIDERVTRDLIMPIADMLKQDNPNFDAVRFLKVTQPGLVP